MGIKETVSPLESSTLAFANLFLFILGHVMQINWQSAETAKMFIKSYRLTYLIAGFMFLVIHLNIKLIYKSFILIY